MKNFDMGGRLIGKLIHVFRENFNFPSRRAVKQ